MQMIDNSMDVHGRARKKRQQAILAAPADGGGNEIQVGETAFAAAPADDHRAPPLRYLVTRRVIN